MPAESTTIYEYIRAMTEVTIDDEIPPESRGFLGKLLLSLRGDMLNAFNGSAHQTRSTARTTSNNEEDIDMDMEADLIVQSVLRAEQKVASGSNVGTGDEVTEDRKPAARPSTSAETSLSALLYELAKVVAHCSLGTKPNRAGKATNIPAEKIRLRIYTAGSRELRQYWDRISAAKSFGRAGYRSFIRPSQRAAFRTMVETLHSEFVESDEERRMEQGSEMTNSVVAARGRLGEDSNEDLNDQDSATTKQIKSHITQVEKQEGLSPDLQELAEIVGRCLYKIYPRVNVPRAVVNREVMSVGSPKLQHIWTAAAKAPRFVAKGYSALVGANDQVLFAARRERVYSELMREKGANESVRQRNMANGRGRNLSTQVPKHVLLLQVPEQLKHQIQSAEPSQQVTQKTILLPGVATTLPFAFQVLAQLVSECMEQSAKQEVCHQTLHEKVQLCDCQDLQAMWNEKSKLYKFERTGYAMLLPRGLRKGFQDFRDQISSSDTDHMTDRAITVVVVKMRPKPVSSGLTKVTPQDKERRSDGQFKKLHTVSQPKTFPVGSSKSVAARRYPITPPELTRSSTSRSHQRRSPRKAKQESLVTRAEGSRLFETPEPIVSFTRQQTNTRSQKRSKQEVSSTYQIPAVARDSKRFKITSPRKGSAKADAASQSTATLQSELETFFKWRFKRIDAAHALFLDEIKDWMDQGGRDAVVRNGRRNIAGQRCDQLDTLREFRTSCCTNLAGDDLALQCSVESFFELIVVNWDKCFEEATKAVDNFGNQNGIPFAVFQQKQRDRWSFSLNAEKACVQSQLMKLTSK